MKKISWTCILAAIVALSGCAEGTDDTSSVIPGVTACTNGDTTCGSNSAYQVCTDGVWGSLIPCGEGETCANGVCSNSATACVENERQCTTASAYKICVSGTWSSNIECGTNQICRGGDCVADKSQSSGVSCLIGFKGCSSDGRLQVCGDDGYLVTSDCPSGLTCSNGECIDPNNTENKCDPSEAATCSDANTRKYCNSNGAYVTETCPNGCKNGVCTSVVIEEPECVGSDSVCADDNTLKTCSNGKYVTETCPNGCLNNACSECSASEAAVCTSSTQIKYCSNGKYVTETCDNGCANGACKSTECSPSDAATCSNSSTRKYCTSAGKYATETCQYGCKNGACNECNASTAATCSNSSTRKYCKNNSFVTETCEYGCSNGECSTSSLPQVGDTCNSDSFEDVCTDSTLYYCKSSTDTVTSTDCSGSSVTCAEMSYGDDCVYKTDQCKNEGDLLFFSSDDCENGILYYISCEKGTDGNLYGVLSVTLSICDGNYRIYCASDTDEDSSYESCSSCTYNASTYSATCSGSSSSTTTPEGSSTHYVGESCTSSELYYTGCDGNTLVYCDGSEYVSYMDCSETSGFYCDEQSEYNYAECVESCTSDEENYIVDFSSTCNSSGEFELYVCEKGDSGNLGTFGGYYATSFCAGTTDYYCSGSSQLSKSCTTCEVDYNSTDYVYEATCE